MYDSRRTIGYGIGFLLVIVLLFWVILLIVRHNPSSNTGVSKPALSSYAADSDVILTETIIGPITAIQTHNEVQISVSNTSTQASLIKGYDGTVVDTKTYPMSVNSFGEFLSALAKAGYQNGDPAASLKDDAGYCSTGDRYIFTLNKAGNVLDRYWATSCGGTKSYKGNLSLTLDLFRAQVPDYNNLVQSANL